MSNDVLPMSKSEIQQLDFLMFSLQETYKYSTRINMISGGFCTTKVINFDNDIIVIEIQAKIKNDKHNPILKEHIKINRHSMEVLEKMEL